MKMRKIEVNQIEGFRLGNAEDAAAGTGCTVIICEKGATAGVDVRGGAPATRETDLLRSENTVESINAVVLSGGSAFGLESASGVMRFLAEKGVGFRVGDITVPIVCAAACYDLAVGRSDVFPDVEMGIEACRNAYRNVFGNGNNGAGTGASVGKSAGMDRAMKAGLGTYAIGDDYIQVGAITAVNAVGDIVGGAGNILAGMRSKDGKTITGTVKSMRDNIYEGFKDGWDRQPIRSEKNIDIKVENSVDVSDIAAAMKAAFENSKAVPVDIPVTSAAAAGAPDESSAPELTAAPEHRTEAEHRHAAGHRTGYRPDQKRQQTLQKPSSAPSSAKVTAMSDKDRASAEEVRASSRSVRNPDTASGSGRTADDPDAPPAKHAQPATAQTAYTGAASAEAVSKKTSAVSAVNAAPDKTEYDDIDSSVDYYLSDDMRNTGSFSRAELYSKLYEEEPEETDVPDEDDEAAEEIQAADVDDFKEDAGSSPADDMSEDDSEFIRYTDIEDVSDRFNNPPLSSLPTVEIIPKDELLRSNTPDRVWASDYSRRDDRHNETDDEKDLGYDIPFNTVISCVITNARLTKSQANKLAAILHDAYARAIKPTHTTMDGDTIFVMATGQREVNFDAFAALATDVLQYAIIDGARSARKAYGLPAARDMQ